MWLSALDTCAALHVLLTLRWLLQCVVLSVGRATDELIITEEPDVSDSFVQDLLNAVTHPKSLTHLHHMTDLELPFELRCVEVALATATHLLNVEVSGVVQAARKRLRQLNVGGVRAELLNLYPWHTSSLPVLSKCFAILISRIVYFRIDVQYGN
jgi:hypothetical protein